VLSQQQVNQVIAVVESGRLKPSFKTNREHVKHVREVVREKSEEKRFLGVEQWLRYNWTPYVIR